MVGYIFLVILFSLIAFVCIIVLFNGGDGELVLIVAICGLFIWGFTERMTVRIGEPKPLDHKHISVMCDEEMAIIRHETKTYEYTDVKHYNAIKEGNFEFMETKEYDVLGEYNGSTFTVKINLDKSN